MYCKNCGTQFEENASTCAGCGNVDFSKAEKERQLNSLQTKAIVNGALGVALAVFTFLVQFLNIFTDAHWTLIFVLITITASMPAILTAMRTKNSGSKIKFLIAMGLGIVATIMAVIVLIIWLAT